MDMHMDTTTTLHKSYTRIHHLVSLYVLPLPLRAPYRHPNPHTDTYNELPGRTTPLAQSGAALQKVKAFFWARCKIGVTSTQLHMCGVNLSINRQTNNKPK